jgi:hypothetical protein
MQERINPTDAKVILSISDDSSLNEKDKNKYLNLASMALISIQERGSLRKVKY